jgi:hypothetical protein
MHLYKIIEIMDKRKKEMIIKKVVPISSFSTVIVILTLQQDNISKVGKQSREQRFFWRP